MPSGIRPINLLVQRTAPAKELRGEFVFRLKIGGERCRRSAYALGIWRASYASAPELQVVPRKTDVLANNDFAIIAERRAGGERGPGRVLEIRSAAERHARSSSFHPAGSQATAESGMLPLDLGCVPTRRPGGKRCILEFHRIARFSGDTGNGHSTGVAWTPQNRHAVLVKISGSARGQRGPARLDQRSKFTAEFAAASSKIGEIFVRQQGGDEKDCPAQMP